MNSIDLSKKIRTSVLTMISRAGSSHIASCLSCADLIAVAYATYLVFIQKIQKAPSGTGLLCQKGMPGRQFMRP